MSDEAKDTGAVRCNICWKWASTSGGHVCEGVQSRQGGGGGGGGGNDKKNTGGKATGGTSGGGKSKGDGKK
ncbi:hypothetical protein CVT26_008755 [Gymnopilus dilepis]|uniref:Uncharacterized protein n=1 Tax=Gymnopilus dilepis TaxID=231916 RepID=A0A409YG35_9AGAR|nr:hypothetical protein CVT26_008755 [Gymnopilus dilepis]